MGLGKIRLIECVYVRVCSGIRGSSRSLPAEFHGLLRARLRKQKRVHAGQELNIASQLLLERLGSIMRNLDVPRVKRLLAWVPGFALYSRIYLRHGLVGNLQ